MKLWLPEASTFNEDIGCHPIIGESVNLVNTLLDCSGQIIIEDNVFFGHNCMILTGSHDYTLQRLERSQSKCIKPVTIKRGAWIASGAIICQGVTIGENAVVGAGSVVLHDIPANELWAGNPCKFIKKI